LEYRKDPLDYGRWSQPARQVKKETDDLVIDYDEKVEDQNISNNDRRSVESWPEIENVSKLLAETSLCEHASKRARR